MSAACVARRPAPRNHLSGRATSASGAEKLLALPIVQFASDSARHSICPSVQVGKDAVGLFVQTDDCITISRPSSVMATQSRFRPVNARSVALCALCVAESAMTMNAERGAA